VALALLGILALILIAQLVRYQAFGVVPKMDKGEKSVTVDPLLARGSISDRNGYPLAIEYYVYDITVDPSIVKDPEQLAFDLGPLLNQDPVELAQKIQDNKDSRYLALAKNMGPAVVKRIEAKEKEKEENFPIAVEARPQRYYPEGNLLCHVLGFVPLNRVGYYGLEGYYDDFLRATTRILRLQPPPKPIGGDVSATLPDSPFVPSYVQQDLVLTIDRIIQNTIETELAEAIRKYEAESGTVIVLDPKTGAVLGMASWPDFNPNDYTLVSDDSIYLNPAISRLYEPGSVFKLITYATALEQNVITPETEYQDEDKFVYYKRTIQNWDKRGRGKVTALEALAQSLNVTTAKIAVDLGSSDFYKAVTRFGFGQLTNVELEGEVAGIVKSPGRNDWYPVDLATNAFGQGISVTPLQMAVAVAAIASDGVLYQPHVVHQVVDGDKLRTIEPKPVRRAISSETAKTLTEMMVYTVNHTPEAKISGYAVAGKSGTAEIPDPETRGYTQEHTIASFVGFFPVDAPQFVILVKLDQPKTSRWATHTAAPLFRSIAKKLIDLYAIPPDIIRMGMQTLEEQP
jgi:cell division protein FtsI/penicillin-binding protein 2